MKSPQEREEEINRTAEMANALLRARKDTLIMTSRELIKGNCKSPFLSSDLATSVLKFLLSTYPCKISAWFFFFFYSIKHKCTHKYPVPKLTLHAL